MTKADEGKTTDAKDTEKPKQGAPDAPAAPKGAGGNGTVTQSESQPVNNPVPGPQSTKTLAPGAARDPDVRSELSDNTNKPGVDGDYTPPNELSADEQRSLERILDGDDETTDPDRPAVRNGSEPSAVTKLRKLVAAIPSETPNEHSVWGAAGIALNVGDLRELVKSIA